MAGLKIAPVQAVLVKIPPQRLDVYAGHHCHYGYEGQETHPTGHSRLTMGDYSVD